jgi:hypothetical protein
MLWSASGLCAMRLRNSSPRGACMRHARCGADSPVRESHQGTSSRARADEGFSERRLDRARLQKSATATSAASAFLVNLAGWPIRTAEKPTF